MKLEDQVVSLDLSKRLKELGFNQESLFYWVQMIFVGRHREFSDPVGDEIVVMKSEKEIENYDSEYICSAYTVAELGEMLPPVIRHKTVNGVEDSFKFKLYPEIQFSENRTKYDSNGFWCGYFIEGELFYIEKYADTMANAMAKMLIYLKENNLI